MDKYIIQNKLNKNGRKKDKLNAIKADVLRKSHSKSIKDVLGQQQNVEESSDSEEDIVLEEIGSDSENENESESEQQQIAEPIPLVVQTRYGRYAGNWALSKLQ